MLENYSLHTEVFDPCPEDGVMATHTILVHDLRIPPSRRLSQWHANRVSLKCVFEKECRLGAWCERTASSGERIAAACRGSTLVGRFSVGGQAKPERGETPGRKMLCSRCCPSGRAPPPSPPSIPTNRTSGQPMKNSYFNFLTALFFSPSLPSIICKYFSVTTGSPRCHGK